MGDAKKSKKKSDETVYTESDVLARIETVLRFTSKELANSETEAQAFEKLAEFEAQLLEQQRSVSAALENVQKYRDEIQKDWDKEKLVHETALDFMATRMKDLYETLRAQEYLLDYAANEQKFLRVLLIELREKRQLNATDIENILARHEALLNELSRKAKK
ncbi:MAG TPA: hypothetical protein PLY93_05335 [Turneriella sp.]|nr:hypothetical protein [Turneriella sp.]